MSVTIETIITCDGSLPECDGTFCDGDARHQTAGQQRSDFKDEGWVYRNGKDYCTSCAHKLGFIK